MPVTIVGNNTPTAGGVVYGDGTNYVSTSAGTAGQVLQSNGSSAPTWAAASSTVELISTATASTSANISFTGLSSTYFMYLVALSNVTPDSASRVLCVRTSTNNGSSYDTTGYAYSILGLQSNTVGAAQINTDSSINSGTDTIRLNTAFLSSTTSAGGWSGTLSLMNFSNTAANKQILIAGSSAFQTTNIENITGAGSRLTTSAINAIQFYMSAGNIAIGTFKLYGVKA